jgi:hypothetical protein
MTVPGSVLFACSNLIHFNKKIHIVFATLNKWFRANQLSLDFNKTNYVHLTTKSNMSVNFKIGFNNNFITNSPYTKFLGVTKYNTSSWNNHIDILMKKLSKACYIIRNSKTCLVIKSDLSCFLPFSYELWNYILGKFVT